MSNELRRYAGRGTIEAAPDNLECAFDLVQLTTGRVQARFETPDLLSSEWSGKNISFRGTTEDGNQIHFDGLMTSQYVRLQDRPSTELRAVCTNATIIMSDAPVVILRYGLTNVDLLGNEVWSESIAGGERGGRQSRLRVGGHDLVIRSTVEGKVKSEVRGTRGVAVTAEATVSANLDQAAAIDDVVKRVCLLLTLASGHGAAWAYREAVDAEGRRVQAFHKSAITKPWGGLELIPEEDLEVFVETSFPLFQEAQEQWDLERTVLALTDAKAEGDYLESRGLKMAIVMEMVRARYLERTGGEWVLPKEKFDERQRPLTKLMTAALEVVFSDEPTALVRRLLNNLTGLNRPTFKSTLSAMCGKLGLPLTGDEKSRFIQIRNELVHRGRFLSGGSHPWPQYAFLATTMSIFLLATLKWSGRYRNWARDPNVPETLKLEPRPAP